jgi:hypothetical protein
MSSNIQFLISLKWVICYYAILKSTHLIPLPSVHQHPAGQSVQVKPIEDFVHMDDQHGVAVVDLRVASK